MKKIIMAINMFLLIIFYSFEVYAEDGQIPLDDTYVEGLITQSEIESMSVGNEEILRTYFYQLNEPGIVNFHFISHMGSVIFELRDADENKIETEWFYSDKSPYDYSWILDPGKYYIYLIKPSYTNGSDGGDYKFKMNFNAINPTADNNKEENNNVNRLNSINLNETYSDYFISSNKNEAVEKEYNFNTTDGNYFLKINPIQIFRYFFINS